MTAARHLSIVPPLHRCDTGIPDDPGPTTGAAASRADALARATVDVELRAAARLLASQRPADFEVRWDAAENAYLATAPGHPHLSWHDADPGRAITGLQALVTEAVAP